MTKTTFQQTLCVQSMLPLCVQSMLPQEILLFCLQNNLFDTQSVVCFIIVLFLFLLFMINNNDDDFLHRCMLSNFSILSAWWLVLRRASNCKTHAKTDTEVQCRFLSGRLLSNYPTHRRQIFNNDNECRLENYI